MTNKHLTGQRQSSPLNAGVRQNCAHSIGLWQRDWLTTCGVLSPPRTSLADSLLCTQATGESRRLHQNPRKMFNILDVRDAHCWKDSWQYMNSLGEQKTTGRRRKSFAVSFALFSRYCSIISSVLCCWWKRREISFDDYAFVVAPLVLWSLC